MTRPCRTCALPPPCPCHAERRLRSAIACGTVVVALAVMAVSCADLPRRATGLADLAECERFCKPEAVNSWHADDAMMVSSECRCQLPAEAKP